MRALKSTDLFAALRVVKEIGVKDELKQFATALSDGRVSAKTQREIGAELIFGLLANCGTEGAEKAFFAFLSGPLEIPVQELREMDLDVFADKVKEFVASVDVEHWKAFFGSLADLMKKQI